jgi:hypothetical protein
MVVGEERRRMQEAQLGLVHSGGEAAGVEQAWRRGRAGQ